MPQIHLIREKLFISPIFSEKTEKVAMDTERHVGYPTPDPHADPEVDHLREVVSRFFSVYETRAGPNGVLFFCHIEPATLENRFERLRMELRKEGYVPFLSYQSGEYVLMITNMPVRKGRSVIFNVILLALTLVTTTIAGTLWWAGYMGQTPIFSFYNISNGFLFFALPLLTILGVHEMGHYLTAKKHNINASLPFFIPFLYPLGTMGAFINMREPIPNRKALMEVGVAGPICGFIVAIPVAVIGLYLTARTGVPLPRNIGDAGGMALNLPLLYYFLLYLFPVSPEVSLHPTAFAGWVGLFVTALNLLPMGQLDGGHVARAFLGKKSHYASYAVAAIMAFLSVFYMGWIIIVFLVIILGLRHPPPLNDITPLGKKQIALGLAAVVIGVVSFTPIPVTVIEPVYSIEIEDMYGNEAPFYLNYTNNTLSLVITDTGNTHLDVNITANAQNTVIREGWDINATLVHPNGSVSMAMLLSDQSLLTKVDSGDVFYLNVTIVPPEGVSGSNNQTGGNQTGWDGVGGGVDAGQRVFHLVFTCRMVSGEFALRETVDILYEL